MLETRVDHLQFKTNIIFFFRSDGQILKQNWQNCFKSNKKAIQSVFCKFLHKCKEMVLVFDQMPMNTIFSSIKATQ